MPEGFAVKEASTMTEKDSTVPGIGGRTPDIHNLLVPSGWEKKKDTSCMLLLHRCFGAVDGFADAA